MADAKKIHCALQTVKDQKSFIKNLLIDSLGWKIPEGITDVEEISYPWTAAELNAEGLDGKIVDGQIRQIQPFEESGKQPWGIFLLEFKNVDAFTKGRGLTGPLRKVLRGLVPKKRQQTNKAVWNRENLLFICTHNYQHYRFAYFKSPKESQLAPLATFGWSPDIPCRTACEFNLPALEWPKNSDDAEGWVKQWQAAFDKERLSKLFFDQYKALADILRSDLKKQSGDLNWAHDYTLQLLNRIMFLHFIQRKRWLGDSTDFLANFWQEYKGSNQPKDTFFEKWLKVLFFEAFNDRFNHAHSHFSPETKNALAQAPYLNGGLFTKNPLDHQADGYDINICDDRIGQILAFFGKYNFTVSEDTPLDKDVAVDPEMIGMVYESLVNISEDEDRRGEAGIFYTPRVEIDMMCRIALVDWLANHLGTQHKQLLYKWIFAYDEKAKNEMTGLIARDKLTEPLRHLLSSITVLDPACGSGSFLVGMLHILDDLIERLERLDNKVRSIYDRRKEIIGSSLYGVDIKDWACRVAELRLWLTLIIDVDMTAAQLHIRKEPLLPNFSFNIRCGDSLVQEVGGIDMAHRRGSLELSHGMKLKLAELRREKIRFYNNDPQRKCATAAELEQMEVQVFRGLLGDRIKSADDKAKDLMRIQEQKKPHRQYTLTGELEVSAKQFTLEQAKREQEIAALMEEKSRLEGLLNGLRDKAAVPFVWDIAFAEIFGTEKDGFDIVIGNPPYVRQENIANPDPHIDRSQAAQPQAKKEYKEKLAQSIYKAFASYFDYKEAAGRAKRELDKKSDLYIYFYFKGLSLLNDRGTFCFITSNSWLDVGYGADLQEFLLRRSHVKMVIDNKAKRSFKSADVNTVIVLLAAPLDKKAFDETLLANTARFVMFNVPFEDAICAETFIDIEKATQRHRQDKYRVFAASQANILGEGLEQLEEEEESQKPKKKVKSAGLGIKIARYIGNKWGGKYLRAPDIYWTILEKGKDKLVRLGDIAEVRFGIKTGANEFFYLKPVGKTVKEVAEISEKDPAALIPVRNGTGWEGEIEAEFLKPVIKSPRELKTIIVKLEDLNNLVFMCHKSENELKGAKALDYIKWGENKGFQNRPTCKSRPNWWDLGIVDYHIVYPSTHNPSWVTFQNHDFYYMDKVFYGIKTDNYEFIWSFFNSSLALFQSEFYGYSLVGGGGSFITVEDLAKILILKVKSLPRKNLINRCYNMAIREYLPIFTELGFDKDKPIREQEPKPLTDRKALDDIVFDALGLTEDERKEVYWSVAELVWNRLSKASSLK